MDVLADPAATEVRFFVVFALLFFALVTFVLFFANDTYAHATQDKSQNQVFFS